jgi:hypothetical protein
MLDPQALRQDTVLEHASTSSPSTGFSPSASLGRLVGSGTEDADALLAGRADVHVASIPLALGVVLRLIVRIVLGRPQGRPRPVAVLVLHAEQGRRRLTVKHRHLLTVA